MINYDPGRWSVAFAFTLKGSVFPKSAVFSVPCAALSVLLHYVIHLDQATAQHVGAGDVGTGLLSGFTFILGFLIVFRSQQAYSRWWEGATLLHLLRGEWFNAYSSLLAFCNTSPDKKKEVMVFQRKLARMCSLLYCTAIRQLSTIKEKQNYELIDIKHMESDSMKYMMDSPDGCEVCLQWIQRLIIDADEQKVLNVAPPILSRVYNQLGNGSVVLNNARKITQFPMPFPLAQMVTCMLLFHWCLTAVICAASVKQASWAGILTFMVTFSFWSINYIAVELEQPFGDDENDLPLYEMQAELNNSLRALLHVRAQSAPECSFDDEELASCRMTERDACFEDISQLSSHFERDASHADSSEEGDRLACYTPPSKLQKSRMARSSSCMSMISRKSAAPEVNGARAAATNTNAVVYGAPVGAPASVPPRDTQGSRLAPAVKHATPFHLCAPRDVHSDAESQLGMCEAPSPTISLSSPRICCQQETPPSASCQWEEQRGPPTQPVPPCLVLNVDTVSFPDVGGTAGSSLQLSHRQCCQRQLHQQREQRLLPAPQLFDSTPRAAGCASRNAEL